MDADQALLTALGNRLREARHATGLSVSELAHQAGVSRRYVTEAEAGRANLSLLKLASLARSLGLPLGELCDLPLAAGRWERVALVGLRGAGKSSVGRELARLLECPFVELDRRIEERSGLSIAEIFDLSGVETWRRLEREELERVLAGGQRQVLATGGSIVTAPATFARLRDACRTVWLKASPEAHLARVLDQGDKRPMEGRPRALEELRSLLSQRERLYARCEFQVDTDGRSVRQVARWIAENAVGQRTS
ncbi:MAG: shikimate kinase [Planctomycetota bacterium]